MLDAIYSHYLRIGALKAQIDEVNEAAGDLGPDLVLSITNKFMAQITCLQDAIDALKVEMKKYEDPDLPLNKLLERITQPSDFDYAISTPCSIKSVGECLDYWIPLNGGPVAMERITNSALNAIAFQAVRGELPSDTFLENARVAAEWLAERGNDTLLRFLESEDFKAFKAKRTMERLS
jgi:hypothetical protein